MPCTLQPRRRLTWCEHRELISYPVGVGWLPLLSCNGSSGGNSDDSSRGSDGNNDDNNDDSSHHNKVHNSSARNQYHSSVHSEGGRCSLEANIGTQHVQSELWDRFAPNMTLNNNNWFSAWSCVCFCCTWQSLFPWVRIIRFYDFRVL